MKKTLVALAVAAVAATSANAAVVYNQDGTKVDVGGSVRLKLEKSKEERADLRDNGSRVTINASHQLGEGLSALAQTEFRFSDKNIGDNVSNSRLFAGFKLDDVGTLTFGKQLTTGDEVGLSDYTYLYGGVNQVVSGGDKVVHFRSATWGGFGFGADYVFGNSNKDMPKNDVAVVGAFYKGDFNGLGVAVEGGFSSAAKGTNANKYRENSFTVGAELSYADFAFAVDYSQTKATKNQAATVKIDHVGKNNEFDIEYNKVKFIELGAKYQVTEKSKVYGAYVWGKATGNLDVTDPDNVRMNKFILGVDYKIHPNVLTFLEGKTVKIKAGDESVRDNAVGLGLRVFF